MSLQTTTFIDLVNAVQTLTFTLSSSQVDEISYSSNQITFQSISGFNLSKSDYLLYVGAINTFSNLLVVNFPIIQNSRAISLPVSSFEMQVTSVGVEHFYYIQTLLGNSIYNTNYVPTAGQASISARSAIIISMQEFLFAVQVMNFHALQVSLN